jgi:hypothetical protein
MADKENVNENGTVNPPMNQDVKLASSPKTEDEKEFGPGRWVFSEAFQRPLVTGTKPGPVSDRTLLDAKNIDEALAESRSKGLYDSEANGVGPSGKVEDLAVDGDADKDEDKPKAKSKPKTVDKTKTDDDK